MGHGKVLLGCGEPEVRAQLAKLAAEHGWSVRALEHRLEKVKAGEEEPSEAPANVGQPNASATRLQSVLRDLENRLGEELSTRVSLKTDKSGRKGRIVIEFYDLDHFDGLMGKLGVADAGGLED